MDTVSRKALIDWAIAEQSEIHQLLLSEDDDDDRSYLQTKFAMYQKFRDKVESLPSTESEGEWKAISEVVQRENAWLRSALLQIEEKLADDTSLRAQQINLIINQALSTTSETAVQQVREYYETEESPFVRDAIEEVLGILGITIPGIGGNNDVQRDS